MSNIILQGLSISDFTQLVSDTVRKELSSNTSIQTQPAQQTYYTTKQVAAICGIAEITVHKLKKKGKIKATYIGRSVRYSENELQTLLKNKK